MTKRSKPLTEAQKLTRFNEAVLGMIGAERFNAFDGTKVSNELLTNQNLWDAVWWDMQGAEDPFMKVTDPVRGNSLYVRAKKGKQDHLGKLLHGLDASNIVAHEVDGRHVFGVWWD